MLRPFFTNSETGELTRMGMGILTFGGLFLGAKALEFTAGEDQHIKDISTAGSKIGKVGFVTLALAKIVPWGFDKLGNIKGSDVDGAVDSAKGLLGRSEQSEHNPLLGIQYNEEGKIIIPEAEKISLSGVEGGETTHQSSATPPPPPPVPASEGKGDVVSFTEHKTTNSPAQ